jgi:hypothetical protein
MASFAAAVRISGVLALVLILSQAFVPALAQTYAITLQTNAPSYSGVGPIQITGQISPAPGPDTGVVITIDNSARSAADIAEVVPNPTSGSFSYTSHPGGNAAWTTGTFTVNATWGGDGETATQVATFSYTASTSSTTSSSTSSTNIFSSTSTSSSSSGSTSSTPITTSSTSSASSTSTTSKATPAPEFPPSALALVALVAVAVVAALSRRIAVRPPSGSGRSVSQGVQTRRRIK